MMGIHQQDMLSRFNSAALSWNSDALSRVTLDLGACHQPCWCLLGHSPLSSGILRSSYLLYKSGPRPFLPLSLHL